LSTAGKRAAIRAAALRFADDLAAALLLDDDGSEPASERAPKRTRQRAPVRALASEVERHMGRKAMNDLGIPMRARGR
jgi:hypothetical protein